MSFCIVLRTTDRLTELVIEAASELGIKSKEQSQERTLYRYQSRKDMGSLILELNETTVRWFRWKHPLY